MQEYHPALPIKFCKEVRFSNGGHMFAVGQNLYTFIYDFYTLECPANQKCTGHSGKIGCIDWRADDSGFSDGCS